MNNFMARLIFCFFAEDTDIFVVKGSFTETVARMSARDFNTTRFATLFRAMNTKPGPGAARIPRGPSFPYVNGRYSARSPGLTCCTSAASTGPRSTPTSSAR
ncbi:MAG: hypothetical protein IPO20_17570 [Gammaproteobacteria bacterium]|nr:hypothetical protein [Gammaproteobacteria bacterium]